MYKIVNRPFTVSAMRCFSTLFQSTASLSHHFSPESILCDAANDFEKSGKVSVAIELYKKIINDHPLYKKAYQDLWSVWARNASLKVPKKEMDDFIYKYEKYIKKEGKCPTPM